MISPWKIIQVQREELARMRGEIAEAKRLSLRLGEERKKTSRYWIQS